MKGEAVPSRCSVTRIAQLCIGLVQFGIILFAVRSIAILILSPAISQQDQEFPRSQLVGDFIEYWSASRGAASGLNIYLEPVMREIQANVTQMPETLMMWNPPWTLLLVKPFAVWSLGNSFLMWQTGNLFLLVLLGIVLVRTYNYSFRRLVPSVLLIATFPPMMSSLRLGQLGVFLCCGTTALIVGIQQSKRWLIVAGVLLLSVKPHLFLLLWLYCIWWIVAKQQIRTAVTCGLACLTMVSLTELIYPGISLDWINAIWMPQGENVFNWVTPTLPSIINLYSGSPKEIQVIVSFIPGLAAIGFWIYLINNKRNSSISDLALPLIVGSIFLSPFGWFFDMAAAAFYFAEYVLRMSAKRGVDCCYLALLGNIALNETVFSKVRYQHQLWWFAPVLVLAYFLSARYHPSKYQKLSGT